MKITITILKTLAGTLTVTLLAVFAIWFMAGGVLFMPPFAVIPVYVVLFILSVLVALVTQKPIVIVSVVGGFVLGVFGFNALYHHTCGPNSADVKVMKPMAEKISDYIVKNGIPKSLKDIPDLPYGLVGCKREVVFKKHMVVKNIDVNSSKDATFKRISETCKYKYNARTYEARIWFEYYFKDKSYGGSLYINNWKSATGIQYMYDSDKQGLLENIPRFYASKSTGICKPWRQ